MGLTLDAFRTQEVTVVRCRGRIVFGKEADELRRILLSLLNESKRIMLDLGWVAYVDSAGLGTLVASFISARHHGTEIKFANPSPMTWKLLKTTNVDRLFEIHRSTDEAIQGFSNYPKWPPDECWHDEAGPTSLMSAIGMLRQLTPPYY